MQGKKFKFYIKNKNGSYYFVDSPNSVQISTSKRELVHAPKGWMEMVAELATNEKYKGNFTKVSSPLQFVIDGKKIIDQIAVFEGITGFANVVIEIQKSIDFSYDLFFDGKIDFQEYKYGEHYSTATIRENLLIDILDAKEDVVFEIPLTASNSVELLHDGIKLLYKTLYNIYDGADPSVQFSSAGSHTVNIVDVINENPNTREVKRVKFNNFPSEVPATNEPFYQADVSSVVDIEFNFRVNLRWIFIFNDPGPNSSIAYHILQRKANGTLLNNQSLIYSAIGRTNVFGEFIAFGKLHTITGTKTINLEAGDSLYFVAYAFNMNIPNELCRFEYDSEIQTFNIKAVFQPPPTRHRAIFPYKLWEALVAKATDNKYTSSSAHLFANKNLLLLSGQSLRREPNPKLQITIKDFLKYCYVNHRGILGSTNNTTAEIIDYKDCFNQSIVSMNLGRVADLDFAFYKNKIINTIKVGYPNQDIGIEGQINGKDEWNQTSHFTTAQSDVKAEYDIVSTAIAGIYPIEYIRVNFGNKGTIDNRGDNKLYVIDAIKDTASTDYLLRRLAFATVTGVLNPSTIYNTEISPKDLFYLHSAIIAAGVYNSQGNTALNTIKFQSGDKNVLFSKSFNNIDFVTQNADELLYNLNQPWYLPIQFTFNTDYRDDLFIYLKGVRRYQLIEFIWKNEILQGFIIDVKSNPDNKSKQQFKLLAAPTANITNII